MAARTGRLLQDPNLGIQMDGATICAKANYTGQRKVGAGGRKPLGDLSNSEKLSTQGGGRKALDALNSGKQLKSKELATMKEEVVPVKIKKLESKRSAPKASGKLPSGNRKALSDISNVGKIKNKSSQKPSALAEEHLRLNAIAEEQCLHNHQECIKSQTEDMGLHNLLKSLGLESDSDEKLAFSSEVQAFTKLKPKSDLQCLELEEVPEKLPEVELSSKEPSLATQHASPARCKSPKISSCYKMSEDFDVNFKLIETPKPSKF
ncbi:uncharacterized protein LOC114752178 [Neltuma alba]|uniref:uncharacterized protein LOC114730363 n=1 Tax=Neltuma alba TaxID=207710 RepID=UPI0010A2F5C2|nr:uncharacterized protein LOC114730363 [Prosopis alba]XP_028796737.1 uncharacterized protein LOC114752178 [Prosopis alba]